MLDALDVMTNLDRVQPYYQAIFSADEHTIIGYEVTGRIHTDTGLKALGPFFRDDTVPDEYRLEVDNLVLEQALQLLLKAKQSYLLFVHRNANLLMQDGEDSFLNILFEYEKQGIELGNIVLEITEHDFKGNLDQLNHLLVYYRTYGIQLAINKVGIGMSNLERLSLLAPDILKIELGNMRQAAMLQSYQDILYSLSLMARRIGATLLYEDIDAFYQLQYAWRNGGRYYQGDYLQEFRPDLLPPDLLKKRLRDECHEFILHEKKRLHQIYELTVELRRRMSDILTQYKSDDMNQWLLSVSQELTDCSFRLYVCDEDGFQQTANALKRDGRWVLMPEYTQKNWSWRPYFLANIMQMRFEQKGRLSDLYADIETGEMIRTFSFPITEDRYVFVDLSYEFLYERDGLL